MLASSTIETRLDGQTTDRIAEINQLLASGRLTEAESVLASVLQSSPSNAMLWNTLGAIRAQRSDFKTAEHDFLEAVKHDPKLVAAWLNLGRLYQMRAGEGSGFENGIAAYRNVIKLDPGNAEAHHQLGLLLHWQGSFAESLAHLDRLPQGDRARKQAVALRCADLAALGRTGEARATAETLLQIRDFEESDVMAVMPAIEAKSPAIALFLLRGLEAKGLAGQKTLEKLGPAMESQGELAAARTVFERLYRMNPSNAAPLLALGRVAWKQQDYEATLSYLGHARDLDPNDPAIHFLFGLAANEMKAPLDAKKSIRRAIELAPENPYYNYAAGVLELQWREKDAAVPYLRKYVEARPQDPRGHLALGLAYFSLLNNEDAKKELLLAASDPATRAGAELSLGRVAVRDDDAEAAIRHLSRAAEFDPQSADAHAELATLYLDRNDSAAARRETEAALAIDHDNFTANRMLLRLYQRERDPRIKEQSDRLKQLAAHKERESALVQRTIEVRPY